MYRIKALGTLGVVLLAGCSEDSLGREGHPDQPGGQPSAGASGGTAPLGGGGDAGSSSPAGGAGGHDAGGSGGSPACAAVSGVREAFVHPGGLHSRSSLERMRYQVAAGQEPWLSSFQRLSSDSRASADYQVRGDPSWTTVERGGLHGAELESDATAAYLNALSWAITGDEAHARKSVQIFGAWQNLTGFIASGTPALDAGLYAYKLIEAAEIIRSTYDGWAAADLKAFQDMLVYPGYSSEAVPDSVSETIGTFYWRIYNGDPGRHGNQDLIAWRAMLIMGVFLDNRLMFERALRYFKGEPHLAMDLPYAPGPATSGAQISDNEYFTSFESLRENTTPDYGYNGVLGNYVWENGQLQESSRDQQHAMFGLGIAAGLAEVAWNQGDDVWNALDQRLLKGFEFTARYNASYLQRFPDQPAAWEPTEAELLVRKDRTGRWLSKKINPHFESDFTSVSRGDFPGKRPIFEQALAHFQGRMGLDASATLWTERARDVALASYGQEPNGFSLDHPGWGGLTFRRPLECAGDPIRGFEAGVPIFSMPVAPTPILAANYDFFAGSGEGRTYRDLSLGNSGAQYRSDGVDLGCSERGEPVVIDIEPGEFLTYTVQIPRAGPHGIEVTYRAADEGAALRFRIDGVDVTGDLALPASPAWVTRAVTSAVPLRAGVQAVRVFFSGVTRDFELHSLELAPE